MKKVRWSQIEEICRAVETVAGSGIRCWIEHAGDVVAGERPERHMTPCTQRVGGTDEAEILAGIDGRGSHNWIDVFATAVRVPLAQQATIEDMASAAARTWRQMNSLLAMASSSSLGLEPGKTIQRIFDMLVRATRFEGGIAIVRLPGSPDCIQLDASGVARVPAELLAGLEGVGETVHTFPESAEEDDVKRACAALLDPFKPGAVSQLRTDNDTFGWLVAASDETLSSDDLKLFGAAARIIGVALENAHTLSLEREATRVQVEKELYQSLAKTAPVGMFRADIEGRVLYVNDRWCSVTGVSEDDALRYGWLCAVHADDRQRVTTEWEQMLVEGKPVRCEHRCERDGGEAWVLTEIAREAQEDGNYVGTMTDITDRKRAEQEKAELETHLRHAHKMEAIGTMAGGIAHDFNNILGAIVGNAELALGRVAEGDRAHVHLDRLLQGAFRARELVRQMLAFSRQTDVVRVPQEVAPVIQEVLALMRPSVPPSITIDAALSPSGCTVAMDATQLHQVVLNLCTNAYQAIGERTGRVEVRLENVGVDAVAARVLGAAMRPGRYARLTVSDNGPGIAEKVRERMFEPFFSTKEAHVGSGLGLAVVHGIVADHGGFVHVDSQPDRGARFEIYLPIYDPAAHSDRSSAAPRTSSTLAEFARVHAPDTAVDAPQPLAAQLPSANENESLEDLVAQFAAVESVNGDKPSGESVSAGALVPAQRASAPAVAAARVPEASVPARVPARAPADDAARQSTATTSPPRRPAALPPPENTEDETLLERLVADFLAGEDGARSVLAPRSTDVSSPGTEHTTLPARIEAGVPATRGQRSPVRTRLIDRAPQLQRGHVKLLGSDRTRRLGQDAAAKLPRPAEPALPEPAPPEEPPARRPAAPKLSFPFMLG
jgi:PAS domain S-box-containing protein